MANPLIDLYEKERQSPWLDFIRRNMLNDGGLARYRDEDGIRGVTANPTIFAQAIGAGDDYDDQIAEMVQRGIEPRQMFEQIAVMDLRSACDIMRPVFDGSDGTDGFVSIEVSPEKAFHTEDTIEEAKRWWRLIERPNLLVKIPATNEGVPAIEECLADGVNINITLIFAIDFYEDVMEAYLRALERRQRDGAPLRTVHSVASFFVSRVDTAVDKLLDEKIASTSDDAMRQRLESRKGKAAIANAKIAYQRFLETFGTDRFSRQRDAGARVQRPLWASTGTKNKAYSDIMYVQELIGPETVNTLPPATIDAFRDHGVVRRTIDENVDEARRVFADLADLGISIDDVTDKLQADGVRAFTTSFGEITDTVVQKAEQIRARVGAA